MAPAARASRLRLPPLLPRPRRSERRSGSFRLRDGLPIVLPSGADDADFASARALAAHVLNRCGIDLPIEGHADTAGLGARMELLRDGNALGAEGEAHRIKVASDCVIVAGGGAAGVRYAVETLAQLITPAGGVPCCRIQDAPDLGLRGIMLDVSRGKVPSDATLRGLVDACLRLKLNALMLYTEHTFRFRRHPHIGAGCSPLTAEQLRALDQYAAERHVQLIPCLQSLGHMEHVLEIPRYRKLAETQRRWSLSPAEPGTYELLEDLYGEYLPNFRSLLFNANCDEPFDLGQGKARDREEELGPGGVFLEHVERLRTLARGHGKRTMIWADVVHAHRDRVGEIDPDLVLLDWWYEAELDYDRVKVFAEHGLDFAVCPGTSSWNCLFPRLENSLLNIERYAEAARRHGALGLFVTDWGDFGHYNLQGNSWMGFAWAAQNAWSGSEPARTFDRAFARRLFEDESGETARLYRALGALHDAGFRVPNASPIQFLFFDDVGPAIFTQQASDAALEKLLAAVHALRPRIERTRRRFRREATTHAELAYAATATEFAVRKTRAARRWLTWRRDPRSLRDEGRRRLASELRSLADEQVQIGRRLRELWLERSEPSNFEITKRRLDRSVRSLRRGAGSLERGRAPAPPAAPDTLSVHEIVRILRGD